MSLTAHCLVKNEEVFIEAAIRSVIDFADCVLVFDTGSTDRTVEIVTNLQKEFPQKIVFEKKGVANKQRHTDLRQEMVERTQTDWWMILDGDEVWSQSALAEAAKAMTTTAVECIIALFYLCVGDVYHATRRAPQIEMFGRREYWYPRFFRNTPGMYWQGDYNQDTIYRANGEVFFTEKNSVVLRYRYWHMTHLLRSTTDATDYSSGGTRAAKLIPTYLGVGKKINEPLPLVLQSKFKPLSFGRAVLNLVMLAGRRIFKTYG